MREPRTGQADVPTEPDAAPDMLAELGPLAYGLLTLGEKGSLSQVHSLPESRKAQVPPQSDYSPELDTRSEALLDALGELDI